MTSIKEQKLVDFIYNNRIHVHCDNDNKKLDFINFIKKYYPNISVSTYKDEFDYLYINFNTICFDNISIYHNNLLEFNNLEDFILQCEMMMKNYDMNMNADTEIIENIEIEKVENISKHKEEEIFRYLNKNKIIVFCEDKDSIEKYINLFYKFSNNDYCFTGDRCYVFIKSGIIEWRNLDLLECKKLGIEIITLDELFDKFNINKKEKLVKESQKQIYNYINNNFFIDCSSEKSASDMVKFVKDTINFDIKIKNKNHGCYAFFVGNRMYFDKSYNTENKEIISIDEFKNNIIDIYKNLGGE